MKTLHILCELQHSGAEVMLRDASQHFAEAQLDTHILGTGNVPGDFAEALRDVGYTVHFEPFRRAPIRRSVRFFWRFYQWLREHRFDVVHIHPEQAFFFYALICWLARVPRVVASIHNVYQYSGLLRMRRVIQTRLVERVFGVERLAIGEAVADHERTHYGSQPTLLPNWINTNVFRPLSSAQRSALRAEMDLSDEDFVLVVVGKCTVIKNHSRLFEIMATLPPQVVCLHIGTGECEADEQHQCQQTGLGNRVRFIGTTQAVHRYMQVADLHVLPSLIEGVGNVYLEASACGLLSLVNDAPGLREVVQYGRTGLLADVSTAAFAETLRAVVENPQAFRSTAEKAQQHVLYHHRLDTNVRQLIAVYRNEQVIGGEVVMSTTTRIVSA